MAGMDLLPRMMVLKSLSSSGYVCYVNKTLEESNLYRDYVRCTEDEGVFSSWTQIRVVPSKSGQDYVHLRFYHSNKHWAREEDDRWILADSNKLNEDTSSPSCTLFSPRFTSDGLLYLIHVQSGKRVKFDRSTKYLYVDDGDNGNSSDTDYGFIVIDRDSLVMIPRNIVFMGDNNKYLKLATYDGRLVYLQFSGSDPNHQESALEVHTQLNGSIRIKSVQTGKFWRKGSSWVLANDDGETASDMATHFWPIKVDDGSIGLRSAIAKEDNQFCARANHTGITDCLDATVARLVKEARLVVEESLLERSIYNVQYRMEDARIFDEQPFAAGTGTASNNSDSMSTAAIKVAYEDTRSYSFTNSLSVKAGVSTTIKTGIPFIAEGTIQVSVELTTSFQWGRVTQEKKLSEATYRVTVPAGKRVNVHYVGTYGKCSVPFSYSQRERRVSDGRIVSTRHDDGIFHGVNYFNFGFEEKPPQPI